MLWLIFSYLFTAQAQTHSRLLPYLQEALRARSVLTAPALAVQRVLADKQQSILPLQGALLLPPLKLPRPIPQSETATSWPAVAVHISQFDVLEASDDWFKDDLYCYFIVTNGVVPHAKVTQIYRGLTSGESFLFDLADRPLFPLVGDAQVPSGDLVIDYGVVESDGDDVRELHQLSTLITELAVAVYQVLDPVEAAQWGSLRQEVVALTRALTELNHDDRLVTGTLVLSAAAAQSLLAENTMVEIKRKHQNNHFFDKWRYRLVWRLLRN